jgi:hypothetical protein
MYMCVCRYFKSILPPRYYKHLTLLAFAMNLAESSVLCHDTIQTIESLLNEFDRLFPLIYPVSIYYFAYKYITKEKLDIYAY